MSVNSSSLLYELATAIAVVLLATPKFVVFIAPPPPQCFSLASPKA
jgi:hypothetical protein